MTEIMIVKLTFIELRVCNMKKIVFCVMLSLLLTACSNSESSEADTVLETTVTQATEATTAVTATEEKTTTTDPQPTELKIDMSKKLDIGKTYKWSISESYNDLFITDNGRYFYSDFRHGASSDHYLVYDNGSGEPENVLDAPNRYFYSVRYVKDNVLYLKAKHWSAENECVYLKLEGDKLTLDDIMLDGFFTEDNVYSTESSKDGKHTIIYKTDYEGRNRTDICTLKVPYENMRNFVIYEDKLLYDYSIGEDQRRFACCDLNIPQKETVYEDVNLYSYYGNYINNGYMYFIDNYDHYRLKRFNIENQRFEFVCNPQSGELIEALEYNFIDDYLIYHPKVDNYEDEGKIFIMNDDECKEIFDASEYFGTDGSLYYIGDIQCTDGHIFVTAYSGGFGILIFEIDIDGNVIEIIHNQYHNQYDMDTISEE